MRFHLAVPAVALVSLGLAATATACGDDDPESRGAGTVAGVTATSGPQPGTTPGDGAATTPAPSPSPPRGSIPGADRPDVQAAVADLAARLGVDPANVVVVAVEEVTWPDGSLGCPQPGVGYTQALVNGQRVVLGVGADRFEYHSGPNRPLFFCAEPRPAASGGGAGDT